MSEQIQASWDQLRDSVSAANNVSALTMAAYLLLGGLLAVYLRWLYARCSSTASDTDSVTRVFPILTVVTTGVIVVVQSSLTLSLGLVGALSIVRFRAAIKEPEELVYLFLCIAVGLALGAGQPLLAVTLVIVSTLFILGLYFASGKRREDNLMLTISGDASRFGDGDESVLSVVGSLTDRFVVQRMDIENGQGQIRIAIGRLGQQQAAELVTSIRKQLPECELSYVNMSTLF